MKSSLLAINYHYIGEDDRYPFKGISGITRDALRRQLSELSKCFEFVGKNEISKAVGGGPPLPRKSLVVTFDDGLREQYREALPILAEMKIPFIFFVNSAPVAEGRASLVHKIHYLLATVEPNEFSNDLKKWAKTLLDIDLPILELGSGIPSDVYPYDEGWTKTIKYLLNFHLSPRESKSIVDAVFNEHYNEATFCEQFYMSKNELQKVQHEYNGIGLHGHNHIPLASLSDADSRREILLCQEIIEEIVSDEISCISYPFGYEQSVSPREGRISRDAKLAFGFTMEMCFNRDVKIGSHLLGRINNNEAIGHEQAAFGQVDNDFVITNPSVMKCHRSWYYNDLSNSSEAFPGCDLHEGSKTI